MNADQFNSLNTWLAILAVVSVVQLLTLAALAAFGYRLYAHSRRTLEDLERRHVAPLAQRAHEVLDNVNAEVARVRHVGDRVQQTVQGINGGLSHAASVVKARVLPGWAVTQGVLAAVSAFRASGRDARHQRQAHRSLTKGGN